MVEDMTTIHVTQDHIDSGLPAEPCYCPVALALEEQLGGVWFVDRGYLYKSSGSIFVNTPGIVLNFIDRFDEDLPVEPFSFELDLSADRHRG